ncbi:MAG: glycosyltransferase family 2 protein [Chloroflexi bacterium]|nr:glycosyltransferase family 2 protein [Chloroflexota bacterium]
MLKDANTKLAEAKKPYVNNHDANSTRLESTGVSIVIPIHNEEESLTQLYEEVKGVLETLDISWELIFIDDGSTDTSLDILNAIQNSDSRVRVIQLRRNFGQTAAMAAGFDYAQGEVIITMDGDLQNDPADIPRLLKKLDEGYDIVSGWRKDRKDSFLTKSLPSKLSNMLASWLTGVHLHDYGCTLKAYRREVIERINLYGELHRYIPAVASSIGANVAEIDVKHSARLYGKSKYGMGRLLRGFLDLISLKLMLSYMTRPMQMFGGLGMLFMFGGMSSALGTVLMKVFMGMDMTGNPMLYLSILFFISGIQLVSLGFLGEMTMRTYHETQQKPIYNVRHVYENGKLPDERR